MHAKLCGSQRATISAQHPVPMRNHRKFGFCYFSYTLKGFLIIFSLKLHFFHPFFEHSLHTSPRSCRPPGTKHRASRRAPAPFSPGLGFICRSAHCWGEISQRKPFKAPEILRPWGFQNNRPRLGAPGSTSACRAKVSPSSEEHGDSRIGSNFLW